MADNTKSIIEEDVSIEGNVFEKESIQINGKIKGNIKAENIELESKGKITGNINSTSTSLAGKITGDIDSDKVNILNTADVEGIIKQKTLSIDEGAKLRIRTETSK